MNRKSPRKGLKNDTDKTETQSENSASSDEPLIKKERLSKGRKTGQKSQETQLGVEQEAKKRKTTKGNLKQENNIEANNDNDNAEYEIQAILNDKLINGQKHYLIRWKGYTEESDTWEPEKSLSCAKLIKEYKIKNKKIKKKTTTSVADSNKSKNENEDYEVERILDVYFHRNGEKEFLVSWKGYPASQNSWEPEKNMHCKDLIEKYMKKVEQAKRFESKETKLRTQRKPVNRLEFKMHQNSRRLSKRRSGKERVHYFDAE